MAGSGDFLNHTQPGVPLKIPAAAYNAFVDAAKHHIESREGNKFSGSQFARSQTLIKVQNKFGAPLEQFAVVKLGEAVITPANDLEEFKVSTLVECDAPTGASAGTMAILQEPLDEDAIGDAVVFGLSVVKLLVIVATDEAARAAMVSAETGYMEAADNGPAIIVWKEPIEEADENDLLWGVVLVDQGGDNAGAIPHDVVTGTPGPTVSGTAFDVSAIRTYPDTGLIGTETTPAGTLRLYNQACGLAKWGVIDTNDWQIIPADKVISGNFHVKDGLVTTYDHTDNTQRRIMLETDTSDCFVKASYDGTKYALLDGAAPQLEIKQSSTGSIVLHIDTSITPTPYITARSGTSGAGPFQHINFIQFGQDSIIIEVGSEDGDFQLQLLAAGDGGSSVCSLVNASAGNTAYKCAGQTGINHANPGMFTYLGIDVTGGLVTAEGGATDGAAFATAMGLGSATAADQGTAVADATGAGDVVAQLNALLASLRTAGLIAT